MKTYPVQMEIAAPLAYFGDPASGAGFQTYLIPPSSAVEGMFRAIAFLRDGAYIRATRAELCSPLKLVNIVTNYRGPYRKSVLVSQGNSQQMAQVCLQDVCYRLYGEAVPTIPDHVGPAHYLQDLFDRRLGRGHGLTRSGALPRLPRFQKGFLYGKVDDERLAVDRPDTGSAARAAREATGDFSSGGSANLHTLARC